MGLFNWGIQDLVVTVIVLLTCMPVHEFAHGWVAYKLGDTTAYYQGRLDLNPFKHLDPLGSIMLLVTQRFGWAKPVPVNPRNFSRKVTMRGGMALTSLAGPVANFLLGLIIMFLYKVLIILFSAFGIAMNPAANVLYQILYTMVIVNVSLGVFNLLPIPPLDGYNIFAYFIPPKWEYKIAQYERYIYFGLLAVLFFTPILNVPLNFLTTWVVRLLDFLTGFVDVLARLL